MKLHVAHVSQPKPGEYANGDRAVFRTDNGQRSLIAVIDGLGHGPEAALAADLAADCLDKVSLDAPILDIMDHVHQKLSGSRGAAGTVCIARGDTMEACAVGNVELRSSTLRLPLVSSAGVLGVRVRKFRSCVARLTSPGRLVLFSDGISSRARFDELHDLSPDATCQEIFRKYRRQEDDATVLVADVTNIG